MVLGPEDNIFVKILNGELPSHEVYKDDYVYCFLDIFPQALGHTLVVPRNFSKNVLDSTGADLAHCWTTIKMLMPAVKSASRAEGITVLTNTGRDAGQMVEYLHFHIVPRYKGDSVSLSKPGEPVAQADLASMAGKIKVALL